MARRELAVAENVPGDLFVDETCIECDTCRELAPEVFGSLESGQSFVQHQPSDDSTWRRALHAVVSCPTASIGAERSAKEAARDLPVGQVLTEADLQVEQRPATSGPVSLSELSQAVGQFAQRGSQSANAPPAGTPTPTPVPVDARQVFTYYFYWYDAHTGQHFGTNPINGLTLRPPDSNAGRAVL